jgi:hypothetical protein
MTTGQNQEVSKINKVGQAHSDCQREYMQLLVSASCVSPVYSARPDQAQCADMLGCYIYDQNLIKSSSVSPFLSSVRLAGASCS